ncbi:MAG TPA: permease, partial [Thermoanaerobaculia bacterium]|nr:permease [Thermoanaerobaculia bacterium]
RSDGLWMAVFEWKWPLTAAAAAGLAVLLIAWFGIARWKVALAALAVAVPALLVPDRPEVAFAAGAVALSLMIAREGGEAGSWFESSWGFAKQILPLLFAGVLVAGMLLGRPGSEGLIPSGWVEVALGGNSFSANLFASVAGAFMYFATLTEVPIVQGLLGNGMGQGPALALLLAGPALSLPNMLVIASVLGWRKTSVYVALVVAMATASGLLYGTFLI